MLAARVLGMLLTLMMLTAAFYPAVDLGAGEKERGTLETLLVVTGTRVDEASLEQMKDVVLDEVNVRAMEYVSSSSGLATNSCPAPSSSSSSW